MYYIVCVVKYSEGKHPKYLAGIKFSKKFLMNSNLYNNGKILI